MITPDRDGRLLAVEPVADFLTELFRGMPRDDELIDVLDDLQLRTPARSKQDRTLLAQRQIAHAAIKNILVDWRSDEPLRQDIVAGGIAELRSLPSIAEFEPELAYLCALHALSSGDFDEARKQSEKALELCMTRSIGPLKLDIARLNFSLAVAQDAFNRGSAERSFRILCKSVQPQDVARWEIGDGPIDYSMRLAAADHAAWFWGNIVRPYEGVEVEAPLQDSSDIIREYVGLIFSGASEMEVRGFIKQFHGKLKRKVRDVRGDTFFTMTSKMVPDIVRAMREMPTNPGPPNAHPRTRQFDGSNAFEVDEFTAH